MRHANPNTTIGLYAQAFSEDAPQARGRSWRWCVGLRFRRGEMLRKQLPEPNVH